MNSPPEKSRIAPIDGPRAVAVMQIVLSHLDAFGPQGGYIGVDIF